MYITLGLFVLSTIIFLRYILSNDRGEREPGAGLWAATGFGFLAIILAMVLEHYLLPPHLLDDTKNQTLATGTLVTASITIGVVEEACKYLPLAFFLYKRRYFNEYTDGIIYFGFSGMLFGLLENLMYTLEFGSTTGINRLLVTPFFHAAASALAGYYLARSKVNGESMLRPAMALAGVIILHAFYDYGLLARQGFLILLSLIIALTVNVSIFLMIKRARREDQSLGLSIVGVNKFCRACGYPNPKQLLYCSRCGKHA